MDSLSITMTYCNNLQNPCMRRQDYKKYSKELSCYLDKNRDALQSLLELRDIHQYTYEHSIGVALYSIRFGIQMELSSQELSNLAIGAVLHDTGKELISQTILDKPDKLSQEEFQIIKKHPDYGVSLVGDIFCITDGIENIIRQHHEKLDGSGYPNRMQKIAFLAQIVSIADMFDALT